MAAVNFNRWLATSVGLDRVDLPATLQRELLPLISHASMYIIPDVGHLLPLEAPTEVASHLLKFTAPKLFRIAFDDHTISHFHSGTVTEQSQQVINPACISSKAILKSFGTLFCH